jgi:hypothetical protein
MNPESALFDSDTQTLFVSNVAGEATKKDGEGWISTFDSKGKLLREKWLSGLNAPKGLAKSNGILWITDIDRLIGVQLSNAKQVYEFLIPDAKFLNDVAADSAGNIFVSDMLGNKIYKVTLSDTTFELPVIAFEGEDLLKNPNGLLFDKDNLVVGQWGPGIQGNFSTLEPGSLVRLQSTQTQPSQNGAIAIGTKIGNIDGVERLDEQSFIVTDFLAGKVLRVFENGTVVTLLTLTQGTADLGINKSQKVIYLPNMNESSLSAYSY